MQKPSSLYRTYPPPPLLRKTLSIRENFDIGFFRGKDFLKKSTILENARRTKREQMAKLSTVCSLCSSMRQRKKCVWFGRWSWSTPSFVKDRWGWMIANPLDLGFLHSYPAYTVSCSDSSRRAYYSRKLWLPMSVKWLDSWKTQSIKESRNHSFTVNNPSDD